jgi:hypothetical protein
MNEEIGICYIKEKTHTCSMAEKKDKKDKMLFVFILSDMISRLDDVRVV